MRMDIAFFFFFVKMPIIDIKDLPDFKTVNLVDLTEDSINKIAEAVVSKLNKHGHWIDVNGDGSLWRCSACGEAQCCYDNYCGNCGAKMDEEGS